MKFQLRTIHVLGLVLIAEILVMGDISTMFLFILYGLYKLAKYLISQD